MLDQYIEVLKTHIPCNGVLPSLSAQLFRFFLDWITYCSYIWWIWIYRE